MINNFKNADLYSGDSNVQHKKLGAQDKGQKHMITEWVKGLVEGKPCMEYDCLMLTSLASILAVESLSIGQVLSVDLSVLENS